MISEWKAVLKTNFTSTNALADFLELQEPDRLALLQNPRFAVNIPRRLANKMRKGTLDDPLARQFLPLTLENTQEDGYSSDPNQEQLHHLATPKMLKKYNGRVLLLPTSACAMHCRFCFRQNFPYETVDKSLDREIEMIQNDPSIFEVILSGGDPLSLPDNRLKELLHSLETIPHVNVIRFHTRFPIGIPERIDEPFLELLASIKKQIVFVIHINHAKELDDDVKNALKKVAKLGIPLFCQSTLLHGVNDTLDSLKSLCLTLIASGIIPYYLHQLDPVIGASRFFVSQKEGETLIKELRKHVPGYAIPEYVKEIPGMPSKTPLL